MKVLDTVKLSELVKVKREEADMGVRMLSSLIGISPATISRIENGETPDVNTLIAILDWLELPLKYFTKVKFE